ncbi:MAG: kynureninase [Microscillaceae bacterium]
MQFEYQLSFAQQQDEVFDRCTYREWFFIPQKDGREVIYLNGNSLGLQPKTARQYLEKEMLKWEKHGVEGHFGIEEQWFDFHKNIKNSLGHLVGASPREVTPMNALTVNLHLLLLGFYRPVGKRTKILIETKAFPSDQYAVASQIAFWGLDVTENLVEFSPRPGEDTLRTEDMLAQMEALGDELALVLLGGVNYYTGQFFDIPALTRKAQELGAYMGLDLAHTIGNLPLDLHDWGVDFACWCTYKYLNSGPGGISGIFVHEKHHGQPLRPPLHGWWGHEENTRFQMGKKFLPEPDIEAWQMSNAPILLLATHKAALKIFEEVGIKALREKSMALTGFLAFVLETTAREENFGLQIITPALAAQRGCQLSIRMNQQGRALFDELTHRGIVADWREPDVIRLAPVPLYNTFEEIYVFGQILRDAIRELQ